MNTNQNKSFQAARIAYLRQKIGELNRLLSNHYDSMKEPPDRNHYLKIEDLIKKIKVLTNQRRIYEN